MKKLWAMWVFLPSILLAPCVGSTDAAADQITFKVKSMAENTVQMRFFSQDRRSHWGNYSLNDYNDHTIRLNCIKDEKICYGAWTTPNANTTWGAGPDGTGGCSGCCYTCNNASIGILLRKTIRR